MGKLVYAGSREVEIEDRTLAHLKIVMLSKLRREENFAFSWPKGLDDGSGRCTLWIHPAVSLEFHFHGSRIPELNREWIERLLASANSPEGLQIIPE